MMVEPSNTSIGVRMWLTSYSLNNAVLMSVAILNWKLNRNERRCKASCWKNDTQNSTRFCLPKPWAKNSGPSPSLDRRW
jgi:hypothetical protein